MTFNTGTDFDGGSSGVGTAIATIVKTITHVGYVIALSVANPREQGGGTMR